MFFPVRIDRTLLRQGTNVIAVELHLASQNSPDATFDLELYANPVDLRHAPDVAFQSPAYGSLFRSDRSISLRAEALDGDGKIVEVRFFAEGEPIGTDTTAPFSIEWQNRRPGTFVVRADAYDNDKLVTAASTVITVVEDTPPTVQLVQPRGGSTFRAGANIPLRSKAFDENGVIRQIDYYLLSMGDFSDPRLVGSSRAAPFDSVLNGIAAGHYMLTAVAIDGAGNVSHSVPAHFHVR